MITSILPLFTFLLASLTTAYPSPPPKFYLATTDQSDPTTNSSLLRHVSATSLFDPYYQPLLLLRLTGPGYGSVPNFTLTSGTLHTTSSGPHGIGTYEYNSTAPVAGQQLSFAAAPQPANGTLSLSQGYLLAVGGETVGWGICKGDLEESVITWKGNSSCNATYIHAVTVPPY